MLIIKRYKRKSGRTFWEYKIVYKDPYSQKTRQKRKKGFGSRESAEIAAAEQMGYLRET
jgi:hypothetical protein